MGLQNATVRRIAVPDMTTTVLTLTLTGIASDSRLAGGTNPRLGRRVTSVALMLGGAALGALLETRNLAWALLPPAALVVAATGRFGLRPTPTAKSASGSGSASSPP